MSRFFPPNFDEYRWSDSNSETNPSDLDDERSFNSLNRRARTSVNQTEMISEGLKPPWSTLFFLRYNLQNTLLRFKEAKVKEPFRFILACLRHRLQSLPDRKERRDLPSDTARAIVVLQSATFAEVVDTLEQRWGQDMPEALYKDSKVNSMLLKLEDSMFGRWYPWPDWKAKPYRLDWREDIGPEESVPIPILGLEYTLSFYFPTTTIDLGNIIELDITWKNVSVFPRWVGRMQNLRRIHIQGGNIRFIPSTTVHHLRIKVTLPSQNPPLNVPGMKSLTEYTSIALKQYLDAGGDWTPLLDLPSHLLNNIIQAKLPKLQDDLDLDEFLKRRRMLTSFGLFQHPYVTELGD